MARPDFQTASIHLVYCPTSGTLTHGIGAPKALRGKVAGCVQPDGYRMVSAANHQCRAHHWAWLLFNGNWPDSVIDHKNGQRDDNRIKNLRLVSTAINRQNQQRARSDNKIGLMGVSARGRKFRASILVDGKKKILGTFDTPAVAHQAVLQGKRAYHPGFAG